MFPNDIDPARGASDKFGIITISRLESLQEMSPPCGFCWERIGSVDLF